jgi:hypothetical protein
MDHHLGNIGMDAPGTAVRIAAIFARTLISIGLSMLSLTVLDVINARMKAVNKSFRERTIVKDTLGLLVHSDDALQLADLVDGILHLCFTQIGYLGHRLRRIGSDYVNSPYRSSFFDNTSFLDDTSFFDEIQDDDIENDDSDISQLKRGCWISTLGLATAS